MSSAQDTKVSRVFAVVNAHSGQAAPERVIQTLRTHLAAHDQDCEIHETREHEDLTSIVRDAVRGGFDTIVAAGGDGTVSAVANGVVGTDARLAILPLGTTNVLARELGVPLDLEAACALISGPNGTAHIDGMKVGEFCYFTQVGVGVDALMIHDTSEVDKRRMGAFAYVWTMTKNLLGYKPRRMTITADDRSVRTRSLQVLLANCGALGVSGLRWGPDIQVDDGRIDVCIFRPRSPLDYPRIAWNFLVGRHGQETRLTYLRASRSVLVQANEPLPVQGDGEIITQTPLTVEIVPRAVRVVVPAKIDDRQGQSRTR
ncbi:diacylglycerol/lipid kinase family protein [Paludisphaera borealis]|uniref:Diacylglycerol kinase n=1 Tax=Paludisphaera borealis TaxID=1387353 RepID=A0A1U7CL72_9BACT|nr:diacylglycerol kinase family protein [Paludisphaera borealis]APW59685.1 Diacylglycerol kinase [Paludisphaera borealis]